MKYFKYLLKLFFLVYVVVELAMKSSSSFVYIVMLLLIIAVNILKERYLDSVYVVFLSFIIVTSGTYMDKSFIIMLCPVAFDFFNRKVYFGLLPVLMGEVFFLYNDKNLNIILLLTLVCGLLGYIMKITEEKEKNYIYSLDDERRLRYELENTKARLLASAKETAYLAEVKERNRIAREIHDNVGHNIAGILIQLQAAAKLFKLDGEKSAGILDKSISGLSETVSLLRDTVHNIKPAETLGIEYIQNIIGNYSFCPVDFKYNGNFNTLSPRQMEMLCSNIKEALTNAAKHSRATEVEISIEVNEKFTRLYIRDNGVGCARMKEGLGLSGMRERVENIGGTFSVSPDKGFMLVCVIPVEIQEGRDIIENINSR